MQIIIFNNVKKIMNVERVGHSSLHVYIYIFLTLYVRIYHEIKGQAVHRNESLEGSDGNETQEPK